MSEKIRAEELRIEKLDKSHGLLVRNFHAKNKVLKDFLIEDAIKNQDLLISTTYLWFYTKTNELVAYTTLLSDSLRIRETDLERVFVDKGILYKSLPALKIGRLCVDERFANRGIGTIITKFSISLGFDMSKTIGCRFIVLDSKREAMNFYKKLDFRILKEEEKETVPMYFDLMDMINLRKEPHGRE